MYFFLTKLFVIYARPTLEYCSVIWNPQTSGEILLLEGIQRNFTAALLGHELSYRQRLQYLDIEPLAIRRLKTDLTMMFKIVSGLTVLNFLDFFNLNVNITRGHRFKLIIPKCNTNVMKHSFAVRTIKAWNALPDDCFNVKSTSSFRKYIDKLHKDSGFMYNYIGLSNEQTVLLLDSRGLDR